MCVSALGVGRGESAFRPVIRQNESGLETHRETKAGYSDCELLSGGLPLLRLLPSHPSM